MNSSVLMESINGQSDVVRTATFNPLLCQECQYLNDLSAIASGIIAPVRGADAGKSSSTDLEELSQKLNCIVCHAVLEAIDAHRKVFRILQGLPAS
jgi:hypothetical protein